MKLTDSAFAILYHSEQLKAANAILNDTPDYFYRKVCRWYSKNFHTPLMQVFGLPYHHVLQHYYEHHMDQMTYNQTLDYVKSELLPVFIDKEEEANAAYAKALEREQAATLAKKKAREAKEKEQKAKKVDIPEFNLNFEESDDEHRED